jgi:hypothetical protein
MLNPKAFKMANRPVIHFQRNIDNQRPFRVAQGIGPAIEIAGQRQNAFHLGEIDSPGAMALTRHIRECRHNLPPVFQ